MEGGIHELAISLSFPIRLYLLGPTLVGLWERDRNSHILLHHTTKPRRPVLICVALYASLCFRARVGTDLECLIKHRVVANGSRPTLFCVALRRTPVLGVLGPSHTRRRRVGLCYFVQCAEFVALDSSFESLSPRVRSMRRVEQRWCYLRNLTNGVDRSEQEQGELLRPQIET